MNSAKKKTAVLMTALLIGLSAADQIYKPESGIRYLGLKMEHSEVTEESEVQGGTYKYRKSKRDADYFYNWILPRLPDSITVSHVEMKLTSLGYYYITAYSPQETGSWMTASGTTLHRADYQNRYSEPTTCAISRSIHSFGDLFYIAEFDRVFVAEDTGSAVRGKHLDLGYTDLDSVRSFPTGYYEVFSVEYVTVYEEFQIRPRYIPDRIDVLRD